METPWIHRFAQRTLSMKGSAIREMLKYTQMPDMISFAGGMPAPESFPVKEFKDACIRVLDEKGAEALQYGSSEGYLPLREMIAWYTAQLNFEVSTDNILITTGSQQALDLIGKIFINPGDRILVESPTYLGALQAWNAYGAEYVTVDSDKYGMIPEALERSLRLGPKFIYVLPNFQNPTGVTMSLERREKLVELADRYGVPIIEDDPYGKLRFEGEDLPSVVVLDNKIRGSSGTYSGNVIYLSTFSKILSPGIRLAWVIAPTQVIEKLVLAKQGTDLHTPSFTQMVAYEVGKNGFLTNYIPRICDIYRERRNVMLDCLTEHMPAGVKWTHPEGGLFLWLTLPEHAKSTDLLMESLQEKVAFVSGAAFFANGGGENTIRLNFSNAKPAKINEGIARLGRVFHKHF